MKRREFLKNLGLATVAVSLPSVLSFAQQHEPAEVDLLSDEKESLDAGLDKPVTAIVIGAGGRGSIYSSYAQKFPGSFKMVGVSDINEFRKNRAGDLYGIAPEHRFGDWSEVFTVPRFADAVIISTPDNLHYEPCMKALAMGYDVLLEKPIAQTEKECKDILAQARKYGRIVAVCHVLRYAPYFRAMRKVIQSGQIGDVISMQHLEPIGAFHMAHSYVRGNWHNSKETTPIILAKSCHDIDILSWMTGKSYDEVSAFGDLMFFNAKNAPANSAERCLDCAVEQQCAFSAKRHYYEQRSRLRVFDLSQDKSKNGEEILEALRTTNYGRCVFRMDNDQCDHYVMNAKFTDGSTLAFSMEALTSYEHRRTRIMGTKGDIVGDMRTFTTTDYLTGKQSAWTTKITDGHGGGDSRLVRDFVKAVHAKDEGHISSSIEASVESHVVGFKSEKSRMKGSVEKVK